MSPYQSGFRRGDSTSLLLFSSGTPADVCSWLRQSYCNGLYDFRKALDTVWHAGLLQKLSDAGWQPLPMVHRLHQITPAVCGSWMFPFISWNASCWSTARFCPWPHSIHPLHKFYHLCYQNFLLTVLLTTPAPLLLPLHRSLCKNHCNVMLIRCIAGQSFTSCLYTQKNCFNAVPPP